MPNQRKDGWRVSTYSAPADLINRAKAKAAEQDMTVSAVIRAALEAFVAER